MYLSSKCPHCQKPIEIKLTAAPPMQSDQVQSEGTGDLGELLDRIDDSALKGAAVKFVEETRERYEKYKERTRMSEKQMKWLREIAEGGF